MDEGKGASADIVHGLGAAGARDCAEAVGREVERLQEELEAERERSLRILAEFDNYRRRVRREQAEAERAGKHEVILEILNVMDDFDRALAHADGTSDAVADGVRLIHQRLVWLLESNGVEPFVSKGRQFDPAVHEALAVAVSDEYESGTVLEEECRGYLWDGELLRPARVLVVR
jgi:molecular chaperone GrpE